jgi:hypothetical protein
MMAADELEPCQVAHHELLVRLEMIASFSSFLND